MDINHALNRGQRGRGRIKSVINFGGNVGTDVDRRGEERLSVREISSNLRDSSTSRDFNSFNFS